MYSVITFDNFRPWPALSVYVTGSAEISQTTHGIELHDLEVKDHEFDTRHKVSKDHPLFKALEAALNEQV